MAKHKRGGAGPKFKGQRFPHRKNPLFANRSGEYSGNNSSPVSQSFVRSHGYTLADEARNTAYNRRGARGNDAKLRYKPVTFISAGFMDPLEDLNVQLTTSNQPQESTDPAKRSSVAASPIIDVNQLEDYVSPSPGQVPSRGTQPSPASHSHTVPTKISIKDNRHPTDSESDHDGESSEEVILFKGRDRTRKEPISSEVKDETNADSLELHELGLELEQVIEETIHPEPSKSGHAVKEDDYIPMNSKPKTRGRRYKANQSTTSDDEAAIIADYMANIRGWEEEDDESQHLGVGSYGFSVLRDLGGTDSDAVPDEVSSEDDTDRSSEEVEGETDEENRRRHLEAEDEHIARMLAKQEELGIGGDDVLLFDGEASDEWMTSHPAPRRKRKGDSKKAKIIQKKGQFPSATQMADAFDELDLMDWHRPSLNNFKKGLPTFDLSDSELEEAMRLTHQRDRLKKAEKKRAREELRSQGLLGKNVNPNDLRIKYLGGMSLDDLANELEAFLLGSKEQLILPPFDKDTRKTVHALANKFKIKSQSAGKGKDRYPVLYRCKATLPFDRVTFDRTFDRVRQTWFPRVDANPKLVDETRILKRAEARSGKSRFKSSLTYREGDIVGQNAVEIGSENKGRTMLEKMGWSKGMALGSEENKGIMVPITHVVKKSKAGLGDA
ncbi:hypothetical protein F4774DRAFT_385486 [Daldinia eschscholtzii]|nr:hypothetical protein F4774DRAFT_385486 [Daldinia eschscholtzii]